MENILILATLMEIFLLYVLASLVFEKQMFMFFDKLNRKFKRFYK